MAYTYRPSAIDRALVAAAWELFLDGKTSTDADIARHLNLRHGTVNDRTRVLRNLGVLIPTRGSRSASGALNELRDFSASHLDRLRERLRQAESAREHPRDDSVRYPDGFETLHEP